MNSLNTDPEFAINSRHWNATIKLSVGSTDHVIEIVDGRVRSIATNPELLDEPSISLGGPEEVWDEILKAEPRPFYHDVFGAIIHHGLIMTGNTVPLYAYYPAIRRMVEVLRLTHNGKA